MVGGLGDVKKVAHEAAHQVARLVAVEEGEAHALVGVEEVLAHAALHARAHHVAPIDHEIATGETQEVHARQAQGQVDKDGLDRVGPACEEPARQRTQDLGEGQVDTRDGNSAGDVAEKKMHLPAVVGQEGAEEPAPGPRRRAAPPRLVLRHAVRHRPLPPSVSPICLSDSLASRADTRPMLNATDPHGAVCPLADGLVQTRKNKLQIRPPTW